MDFILRTARTHCRVLSREVAYSCSSKSDCLALHRRWFGMEPGNLTRWLALTRAAILGTEEKKTLHNCWLIPIRQRLGRTWDASQVSFLGIWVADDALIWSRASVRRSRCGNVEPSLGYVDLYEPLDIQVESECVNIHTEQVCGEGSDQHSLDFIPALKPLVIPTLDDSELFGLMKASAIGFSHTSHWTGSG